MENVSMKFIFSSVKTVTCFLKGIDFDRNIKHNIRGIR